MMRYKIVKKMSIVLLTGMMTMAMAPWTVYAETTENEVCLEEDQDITEEVSLMNADDNGEAADPQGETGGNGEAADPQGETGGNGEAADLQDETDGDIQGETDDNGTDTDLQGETDNSGTPEDPQGKTDNEEADGGAQDTTDQGGIDGADQSGDQSGEAIPGGGGLPEGMPGDLGGLTGGGTALSQVDPATGIAADADDNVFPAGTLLYVTPIESGESYDQISTLMSMIADQFKVYDIRFINMMDYSMTEPSGMVRISIPVPEGFDTDHLSVSKLGEDGTRTETVFEIVDGKAVFETESAGTFLISQMKVLPESLTMTEKTARVELTKSPASLSGSTSGAALPARLSSPKTGDDNDIAVWAGLMGAAVVVILVFVVIKGKNRKKS